MSLLILPGFLSFYSLLSFQRLSEPGRARVSHKSSSAQLGFCLIVLLSAGRNSLSFYLHNSFTLNTSL